MQAIFMKLFCPVSEGNGLASAYLYNKNNIPIIAGWLDNPRDYFKEINLFLLSGLKA